MAGACLQKNRRILRRDAAARLESLRVCRERRKRLLFFFFLIRRGCCIQQNDMPSFDTPVPVKSGIEGSVLAGHKVFCHSVPRVPEASSYNLFDTAVMDINTRSKFHNFSFSFFLRRTRLGNTPYFLVVWLSPNKLP